ncbi:MAG: hypothetical protein WBM40_19820 [Thiohalocapsa sp.]
MKQFIITIAVCACVFSAFQLSADDGLPSDAPPNAPPVTGAPVTPPSPAAAAGYPTEVIADYVIGCMLSNGASPEVLRKCACSLDFIAESIPYAEYEKVDTLLRLQQMPGGGRNAFFKSSNWAKNALARLREVQAESTLRCF